VEIWGLSLWSRKNLSAAKPKVNVGIERAYIHYKQVIRTVVIETKFIRTKLESMVGIFKYDCKFCPMGWKIQSRRSEMYATGHEHADTMGLPRESCLCILGMKIRVH
jgi:hypothetical protein